MHISKKQFYVITILFLLVPFSAHWKLFIFGEKTEGIVIEHIKTYSAGSQYTDFSIIQYQAGNKYYEVTGPENMEYPIGKHITVFCNKQKPEKFILLTFASIYFSDKIIIPGVLFIMWIAFYISRIQP